MKGARMRKPKRPRKPRPGLPCPVCGHRFSEVIRTLPRETCIRREHRCGACRGVFLSLQRPLEIFATSSTTVLQTGTTKP